MSFVERNGILVRLLDKKGFLADPKRKPTTILHLGEYNASGLNPLAPDSKETSPSHNESRTQILRRS